MRLLIRLLSALVIAANSDDILIGKWQSIGLRKPMSQLTINLPVNLAAMGEEQLLESSPDWDEDNVKAPLLGLGFSLRLVRNLANNIGGSLEFYKKSAVLSLPTSRESLSKNSKNTVD